MKMNKIVFKDNDSSHIQQQKTVMIEQGDRKIEMKEGKIEMKAVNENE